MRGRNTFFILLLVCGCVSHEDRLVIKTLAPSDSLDAVSTLHRYLDNFYVKQDFFAAVYDMHPLLNRDTAYRNEVNQVYLYTKANPIMHEMAAFSKFKTRLDKFNTDTLLFKVDLIELDVPHVYSLFMDKYSKEEITTWTYDSVTSKLQNYLGTEPNLPLVKSNQNVLMVKHRDLFYIRQIQRDTVYTKLN